MPFNVVSKGGGHKYWSVMWKKKNTSHNHKEIQSPFSDKIYPNPACLHIKLPILGEVRKIPENWGLKKINPPRRSEKNDSLPNFPDSPSALNGYTLEYPGRIPKCYMKFTHFNHVTSLASKWTLSYATAQCVRILLNFYIIQVTCPFDVWK